MNYNDINGSRHCAGLYTYQEYMNSYIWKDIKAECIKQQKNVCQICNHWYPDKHLTLHHTNYDRTGQEHKNPDDRLVLCHNCHNILHKESIINEKSAKKVLSSIPHHLFLSSDKKWKVIIMRWKYDNAIKC